MPIAYLDVPTGADHDTKRELVKSLYGALREVYPFPDDTRIFLREWPLDSVSQNGKLGSEPAWPVFTMHVPLGGDVDAKRKMLKEVNAAVANAYRLPEFAIFMIEHSLETVAINGTLLSDDQQRVENQSNAYPAASGAPRGTPAS